MIRATWSRTACRTMGRLLRVCSTADCPLRTKPALSQPTQHIQPNQTGSISYLVVVVHSTVHLVRSLYYTDTAGCCYHNQMKVSLHRYHTNSDHRNYCLQIQKLIWNIIRPEALFYLFRPCNIELHLMWNTFKQIWH